MKRLFQRFFIEGVHGMACSIFVTWVLGSIFQQIAGFFPGDFGNALTHLGDIAISLTGVGIGVGIACRLHEEPLVVLCAGIAGMAGGTSGPGQFLGAFLAAFTAIELSRLLSGKTSFDLILCPLTGILCGGLVGIWISPPVNQLIEQLGNWINWGTQQQPFLMGMVVSILMGIAIIFPINTLALGSMLGLSGLAAGAATIGCCCSMVGMAVASYQENGFSGLLSIGAGTPLFLLPNVLKNPLLLLPSIISSAILGPVSVFIGKMQNSSLGSGLGTMGLAGQITTWETMITVESPQIVFFKILLLHFILPGILTLFIANGMRRLNFIKSQDMLLCSM